MNSRIFNIISIGVILLWIAADKYLQIGAPAYGWLLLMYVVVLFCGSYFIRMGFFMKSVCRTDTKQKVLALTFDDGPADGKTDRILDILAANGVQGAFFCIGKNMAGKENLMNRIIAEGHIIGNHSYSHHVLFDLFSARRMQNDMIEMNAISRQLTGHIPRFFRPPYGVTNPNLKKAILKSGMISVGWSLRSYDTVISNGDRLLQRILNKLHPGAILLLHDSSDITVSILPALVEGIRAKGYRIVRLDKMIHLTPYA